MSFRSLRNSLMGFLTRNKSKENQFNPVPELSEKSRLLHRLNCIHLDDEEIKCLQAYLTTILDARNDDGTSDVVSTDRSNCIVLEMDEEELQTFASHVGGNGIRLFRAIVHSGNSQTPKRKLAIVGENGLQLFNVLVQSGNSLLQN